MMSVILGIWQHLGKLHPLLIHFPLSLLWLAFLLEIIAINQKSDKYLASLKIILYIVAISASLSIVFGLILEDSDEYSGSTLAFHKWLGIATGILSWLTLYAFLAKETKTYRLLLTIATLGVSITGHFGGMLTHGDNYFTEIFTDNDKGKSLITPVVPKEKVANPLTLSIDSAQTTPQNELATEAFEILQNRCFDCHSAKKAKGKLRLDEFSRALKGGKQGPAFVLNHPEKSEMIRRIKLPATDDEAMPTKGKRLTKHEVEVLQNWIKEGAVYPNAGQSISEKSDFPSITHTLSTEVAQAEPFQNRSGVSKSNIVGSQPIVETVSQNFEVLSEEKLQELNINVRTILAHNCYSCHNATKTKGGLRMDTKELLFKGGENGPIFLAGKPAKSEMIRRVKLPEGHDDAMPTKGKRLTKEEIEMLEYWIKIGAPWPNGPEKTLYRVAALEPRLPVLPKKSNLFSNPVDLFVNQYFTSNNIKWQQPVNDRIYMRRVYLDVIGLLPSPDELKNFIADKSPNKREQLVNTLLQKNEAYAQHWLTFWNDALRNDYTGTGYITNGRYSISTWLYNALKTNKSYDKFVKELISPTKESEGFIKGIQWRGTVNSSQTTAMQAAQNVAQVFLGLNLKCASCHDSFISDWKLTDAYGLANIFADSTLEIHRCDVPTGKMATNGVLFNSLGKITENTMTADRLKQLADILVQKKNGRFYRTLVNRIWAQLLGRGIVEPVDMMDNEPWSQDLLDYLAYDFANNGTDIKRLMRLILTSKTYQLPSNALKDVQLLTSNNFVFKGMVKKRITAEQFSDVISQTFYPLYTDSAIAKKMLPAEIFKEIPFPRASLVINDAFLLSLGRPTRETVSTSRITQANLLQALELTNGTKLNSSLQKGAEVWVKKYPKTEDLIVALYQKTLNRAPNYKEMSLVKKYIGEKPTVSGIQDLVWAVALLPEFQIIN